MRNKTTKLVSACIMLVALLILSGCQSGGNEPVVTGTAATTAATTTTAETTAVATTAAATIAATTAATATAATTTAAVTTAAATTSAPAPTTPVVNVDNIAVKLKSKGIVFRNQDEKCCYNAWPSVAKSNDNKILVVFSGYRAAHICPFGKTVMCTSDMDNIDFTGSARVINDSPLDDRDAGILNMGNGDIMVTWFRHSANNYENKYFTQIMNYLKDDDELKEAATKAIGEYKTLSSTDRQGGSFYMISYDNAQTFGDVQRFPVSAPHGPIALSDGKLLYVGKGMYSSTDENMVSCYVSTDYGVTWNRVGNIPMPLGATASNMHEPHVAQLADGSLVCIIRGESLDKAKFPINNLTQFISYFSDGGKTWSVPTYMDISGAPPHLLVHSSGALICTFGRREKPYGIRTIISYDGGKTWSNDLSISGYASETSDLGYPASIELNDGSIMTVYYMRYPGGDKKTSILYSVWDIVK